MYPLLFQLGPVPVYTFGTMLTIGFIAGMALLNRRARTRGLQMAFITDYLFALFLASVIASRAYHVLWRWGQIPHTVRDIINIFDGNMSLVGGLIGFLAYFTIVCVRHHQPVRTWFDTISLPLFLILCAAHIGYVLSDHGLSSQAFGTPTDLPWGMAVDFLGSPYAGTPLHPIGLYLALTCAALSVMLVLTPKIQHHIPGRMGFAALAIYAGMIAVTELLRQDASYTLWNINVSLWITLIIAIIATVVSVRAKAVNTTPDKPAA